MAEQLTFNQLVAGSIPVWRTMRQLKITVSDETGEIGDFLWEELDTHTFELLYDMIGNYISLLMKVYPEDTLDDPEDVYVSSN